MLNNEAENLITTPCQRVAKDAIASSDFTKWANVK
jgi:hypothetical protein